MSRNPPLPRRLGTIALWPVGVGLTSWNYMWRTTPMHRRELPGAPADDGPPPLPPGVDLGEVQHVEDGAGPLFHRRYRIRIRDAQLGPEELVARVSRDLNAVAPTEFARFHRLRGEGAAMAPGDEYVVHMAGPWNGPVRVLEVTPTSFRLVTLDGHLEAGQIEFRAGHDGLLTFAIESWARSGDRISNLLYQHVRMAKEIQLHMWTSFLEGVVKVADGRMTGGIDIDTRRIDEADLGG